MFALAMMLWMLKVGSSIRTIQVVHCKSISARNLRRKGPIQPLYQHKKAFINNAKLSTSDK
jgi:hypothetical protein